jgi:hypothetical protein
MNILKDDHYISIPINQYEEMERIINEKKDINVLFSLVYYNDFPHYTSNWYCHTQILDSNENVLDLSKIGDISKMIETTSNNVSKMKDYEISLKDGELKRIKSKWWYKLFVWLDKNF